MNAIFPRMHAAALPGLVLAALTAACGEADDPRIVQHNVLLVVVDTLRTDHVGCQGSERDTTPSIDRLASESVRFERAYATAPWTIPSVASMLSGLYPSRHAATSFDRQLPDEVETLAEILVARGYATAAVISHIAIDTRHNFHQGFDVFLESEAQGHDHVSTNGVTRQAVEQLDRLERVDAPFLLFVHYFDPHYNYKRHPDFAFAAESAGRLTGDEPMRELLRLAPDMTEEEVRFLRDVYDEEIRFTDAGIGRLLEALDERGLREDTIVVLTADHGEEFLDHGTLGHTSGLYEELIRVPLLVRGPGIAPAVVEAPVSLISLTPTVLDLLGLAAVAPRFQGTSLGPLLGGGDPDTEAPVFAEVDFVPVREGRSVGEVHKKALISGQQKLIRDDVAGGRELYDLKLDPGEMENLEATDPQGASRLDESLERALAFARSGALEAQPRAVDPEEIERLRSLGYVGD